MAGHYQIKSIRPKRQQSQCARRSDVVEGRVLGLEVAVWLGRFLALPTSLTDQGSKSMSIPDGGGFLDGARDVVVGVAKLVG